MLADGLPERLEARLERGRAAARARMRSRCTVKRKTGATTKDSEGFTVPVWATVHTDLPLRLAGVARGAASSRAAKVGGAETQIPVRVANLPHDTTDLADGDLIEIDVGENAGLVLQIVEATWQDQATARRIPVTGTERPEEWG
ncbi:DUF6093 family protein [Pimelobacter simplex]|uniref:DUF6093 family protein n=1 Tax=Nocardioides simplex TaxID=2045 RepID=UPI0021503DF7|nr:DUF6093 family protein [Pimelobacter simplex]UUW88398.1 DUF6093 family protein [Pimelobacter simplex]UUW97902.1 DUF6093 family protein [Pimelobacter simplex]